MRHGRGTKCDGDLATVASDEAAVDRYDAKLAKMKPAQRENAGYAHVAEVFAAIPGVTATAADIEGRLKLLLPFVAVVLAELATIVFLSGSDTSGKACQLFPSRLTCRFPSRVRKMLRSRGRSRGPRNLADAEDVRQ